MLRRHEKHFVAAGGIVAVLLMPLLQHLPGASAEAPECKSTRGGDDLDRAVRSSEPLGKQTAAALFEVFEATSNLDEGPAVIVHKAALGDAIAHRGRVEIRRLPLGNGRSVALEVEPLRVVGQKTRFVVGRRQTDKNSGIVDVPFPYDTSQVHLFRGKVQGYPESNVVLFESPRRIAGHIDLGPADGRYKLTSQAGSRSVKVRRVDGIPEARPDVPLCGTHFNTSTRGCCDEPPPETTFTKGLKTVELAVETDYDLYENFNDLAVATDYVIELIARTNAIFMRDMNT